MLGRRPKTGRRVQKKLQLEISQQLWKEPGGASTLGWRTMQGADNRQGALIEAEFWEKGRSFVLDLGRQVDEAAFQRPRMKPQSDVRHRIHPVGPLHLKGRDQDTIIKEPLVRWERHRPCSWRFHTLTFSPLTLPSPPHSIP